MMANLSSLALEIRDGLLAGVMARDREKIERQLRETGRCTVREGERVFVITVPRSWPAEGEKETQEQDWGLREATRAAEDRADQMTDLAFKLYGALAFEHGSHQHRAGCRACELLAAAREALA